MITFDIELPGKEGKSEIYPITIHNNGILGKFMEHPGKLIEFLLMAVKALEKEENDIIKMKLKETRALIAKPILKQLLDDTEGGGETISSIRQIIQKLIDE